MSCCFVAIGRIWDGLKARRNVEKVCLETHEGMVGVVVRHDVMVGKRLVAAFEVV